MYRDDLENFRCGLFDAYRIPLPRETGSARAERPDWAIELVAEEVNYTINAFTEIIQSVEELDQGGQKILESSNNIHDITLSIRQGSNDIKQGTEMMLDSSSKMRNASRSVAWEMTDARTSIQEIADSTQMMVSMSGELNTIVEELQQNFGRFRT